MAVGDRQLFQKQVTSTDLLSATLIEETSEKKFISDTQLTKLGNIQEGATAVSVSETGTATDVVSYITVNGTEKKIKSEPDAFLKNASVSGNTLTLTKKDDSTVTFTDTDTTYTAGANVEISAANVISATDTTYSAGTNVSIDADNKISAVDTIYTAGDNIAISAGNVISATDTTYTAGTNVTITDGEISAVDTTYTASNGIAIDGSNNIAHTNTVTPLTLASIAAITVDAQGHVNGYTKTPVEDSVTSTSTVNPLSANQGKLLNDRINNLESLGRYLSIWNSTTGKPVTDPQVLPYTYKSGDWYYVGQVGATNYKPSGTSYTGDASTVVESGTPATGDIYIYDGSNWALQKNHVTIPVTDVQNNGVSVVSSGIANFTNATTTQAGLMSAADKVVLDGFASGATNLFIIDSSTSKKYRLIIEDGIFGVEEV